MPLSYDDRHSCGVDGNNRIVSLQYLLDDAGQCSKVASCHHQHRWIRHGQRLKKLHSWTSRLTRAGSNTDFSLPCKLIVREPVLFAQILTLRLFPPAKSLDVCIIFCLIRGQACRLFFVATYILDWPSQAQQVGRVEGLRSCVNKPSLPHLLGRQER